MVPCRRKVENAKTKASATIGAWGELGRGELTEEAIRAYHVPPSSHRISKFFYPIGTKFPGRMRRARAYVVSGQCVYTFHERIAISAGQFADLPEGDYTFEVVGLEELQVILVWRLP